MRGLVGIWVVTLVGGCGIGVEVRQPVTGPAPPFEECEAESYAFVGESSLAALGLDKVTPVPPPAPERVGMVWVTADPVPYDAGPPGGPVRMLRSFCMEYADGGGLSEWPIDDTWQEPAALTDETTADSDLPASLLALVIAVVLVMGASVVAFRRPT